MNCPNHALGDCLRPYSAFRSLHTFPMEFAMLYHGGKPMYTSSSKSLCRNAFFTSNCHKGQSRLVAIDNKTLMVFIFWVNPLATTLALYRSIVPSALYFIVNTRLHPSDFFPLGSVTTFYVLFFCNASISTCIAFVHLGSFKCIVFR